MSLKMAKYQQNFPKHNSNLNIQQQNKKKRQSAKTLACWLKTLKVTSIRTKQIEFLSHPTFPKIFCAWRALEFSFIYICCRRDTAPPCLPPQRRELGALPAPHIMKEGKGKDPLASSVLEHLGCLLPGWRCCIQSLDILFLYGCLFSFSGYPSWWCSWGGHLPIGPSYHTAL